jgi:hypothetical protein
MPYQFYYPWSDYLKMDSISCRQPTKGGPLAAVLCQRIISPQHRKPAR